MGVVLRQQGPLLATIWAEPQAVGLTEWIHGEIKHDCIADRRLKVHDDAIEIEKFNLIKVVFNRRALLRVALLLSTIIFIEIELLNSAIDFKFNWV
jgi:hypothetical protein